MERIKLFKKVLLSALVLLGAFVCANAFALDYYWASNIGNFAGKADTPLAACQLQYQGYTLKMTKTSDTRYECSRSNGAGGWIASGYVLRYGDGCAAPKIYDPASAGCIVPSPDAGNTCGGLDEKGFKKIINTAGECVRIFEADTPAQCKALANTTRVKTHYFVSYGGATTVDTSTIKSVGNCEVSNVVTANCKAPPARGGDGISLSPGGEYCDVVFTYTGNVSGATDKPFSAADPSTNTEGVCSESMDCTPQDQPKIDEKSDCQYIQDEYGRRSCVASSFEGNPGSQQCAVGESGRLVCVTKPTSSTGNKVETKVDTKANTDGSTTTTKTDVATKVECPAGPSSCKSTTTTTTTTTSKNANGEVTGTNTQTTCNGDKCAGGSTGGGGGGNNGKGDDTTNCDPSTDPKACEGASTDGGGKKCDAPIKCDGDAVMCAILQQQHKDTCELMKEPTEEQKSKLQQDTVAEQAKVDALQTELDQKATSLFADFQTKASGSQYGGKCLEDKQVDIMGASFTFPFSQACPYLYLLRYALIAMAYLAAARIVSRGI